MNVLLIPFLVALGGSLLFTPLVRAFARRIGMVASPVADRWHRKPTALLGGIAIFGGFVAGSAMIFVQSGNPLRALPNGGLGILAAAVAMFVTGLIDDRIRMRPASKLVMQVVAAVFVVGAGVIYPVTGLVGVDVVITIFWFLALTNALNLLDNMDGVTAGIAAIAGIFLGIIFLQHGQLAFAGVCLTLAGAAIGFLPYNFHPASIFMGDSGSLFLGAVLAGLGAAVPSTAARGIVSVLFVPAFIVVIPILDTLLVTTTRTLAGRPISVGGRDHTTHRLVALGLSERGTAGLLYACACTGGLFALALGEGEQGFTLLGVLFLVALSLGAAYLGRMRVYAANDTPPRIATVLVTDLLYKKRALEFILDIVLFGSAYYGAYLLRWDFVIPATQAEALQRTMGAVIAGYAVAFGALGVYRGDWRTISIPDAHRILRATVLGGLLATFALVFFYRQEEFARSALLLTALLVALLTIGVRVTFRSIDLVRRQLRSEGSRTLVYGAGSRGEIAVREMLANRRQGMQPVAFLDDDPLKRSRTVQGIPVLGTGADLTKVLEDQRIECLLIATSDLNQKQLGEVHRVANSAGIPVYSFTFGFQPIDPPAPRRVASGRLAVE